MKTIINQASALLLTLVVLSSNQAVAQNQLAAQTQLATLYQDPLDLPALTMNSAAQSLLLDVVDTGQRLVAVGERGHILYSDDHGLHWQQAKVDSRAQLNAVFFIDDQTGWAVGEDAIIVKTIDGGISWHKQFDDRESDIKGPLLDIYFKNAQQGLAIGVFNKLYYTDNGGKNWQNWQLHADNLDEWHFFAMAVTSGNSSVKNSANTSVNGSENTIYLTSEAGLLFRSTDGGNSFLPLQTGHDGSFHGLLARRDIEGDSAGNDRLLIFGVGGKLFSSNDSGNSWLEIATHIESGLSGGAWLDDGSALLVGADGVMLRISSDLTRVTKFQRDNGLPLSNAINTGAEGLVLVGLGGIQMVPLKEVATHD